MYKIFICKIKKDFSPSLTDWWHGIIPGVKLALREVTNSDIERLMKYQKNLDFPIGDFMCEIETNGSLIHKDIIESMEEI